MERYDEALAVFSRAIELNPSWDWAIAQRGKTFGCDASSSLIWDPARSA
jgi:hypothetical protein